MSIKEPGSTNRNGLNRVSKRNAGSSCRQLSRFNRGRGGEPPPARTAAGQGVEPQAYNAESGSEMRSALSERVRCIRGGHPQNPAEPVAFSWR